MRGLCQNCCYLCTKCVSVLKDFRPIEGYHNLSHALILYSPQTRDIFSEEEQARKPRSYASLKLRPTHLLTTLCEVL